jgi:hypothetical protein
MLASFQNRIAVTRQKEIFPFNSSALTSSPLGKTIPLERKLGEAEGRGDKRIPGLYLPGILILMKGLNAAASESVLDDSQIQSRLHKQIITVATQFDDVLLCT